MADRRKRRATIKPMAKLVNGGAKWYGVDRDQQTEEAKRVPQTRFRRFLYFSLG